MIDPFYTLCIAVERELMRHGFPSFKDGHERGLWFGIPNELAVCNGGEDPIQVAREIMWWHTPMDVNDKGDAP